MSMVVMLHALIIVVDVSRKDVRHKGRFVEGIKFLFLCIYS